MFSYKIVILGDFGVGKTSLIRRFVDNTFSEDYLSTIGATISKKNIVSSDGTHSIMMIWDTEGRTEHNSFLKQYLNGSKAYVIVADSTRQDTVASLNHHIKMCQSIILDAPIYVAINKSDLESDFMIQRDEVKALSPYIRHVYLTSAKTGDTVNTIFNDINTAVVSG